MIDFRIDNQNVQSSFDEIATELFNNYDLQVNQKKYQLTELEFYFFCEQHPDGFTYKHKEIAGKLRFHYSGVDITLREKEGEGHGGILIRGIKAIDGTEWINGQPLKVLLEISKSFINIFTTNTLQFVVSNPKRNYKQGEEIIALERINLKKVIPESEYQKSKYRYKLK